MNFKALDSYLDTFFLEKNIPGAGIAVYRYGKLLHTYCTGYADIGQNRRFAPDTMINLYSATKIATCTTAMRLVERGELRLDDPVTKYLPEAAHAYLLNEKGEKVSPQSTMLIRHLFAMSAGFSYDCSTEPFKRLLAEHPNPTLAQVVRVLFEEHPLLFEPGTHFKYSLCHDVLGRVIEVVSGLSLAEAISHELLAPIGMKNTSFRLNAEQRARLAPEYEHFDAASSVHAFSCKEGVDMGMGTNYESGGGGLISCVQDYALLAATLANGGIAPNGVRILKPESISLMQQNQQTPEGLSDFAEMGGWSKAGYGYGLGVRTLMERERNNSLSCNGEFGWDGALGCYVLADPASGVGIFYAQQERGSQWWTWHGMIRNHVYAAILGDDEE